MFEERGYVPFRRHAQPTIVSNYPWDSFESPLVGLRGGWGTRYQIFYKYNMDSQTNNQLKTPGKRLLTSSNESSPSNEQTTNIRDLCATDAWPRFLVMESTTLSGVTSRSAVEGQLGRQTLSVVWQDTSGVSIFFAHQFPDRPI